jgi:hypothetical protein
MASGSRSVGGTWIIASLPVLDEFGESGIAPVTSPADENEDALFCGIGTEAMLSLAPVAALKDCRPIGVGDVIEGVVWAGIAGLAPLAAGEAGDGASVELSAPGIAGGAPVSSSVIAILNVPSTITTTLAPTSKERIFEVMFEVALASSAGFAAFGVRPALSGGGAAAAACAARRAAAMKLDVLTGSLEAAAGMLLIALSEAAMRSDGEATRADGRVPGSSG